MFIVSGHFMHIPIHTPILCSTMHDFLSVGSNCSNCWLMAIESCPYTAVCFMIKCCIDVHYRSHNYISHRCHICTLRNQQMTVNVSEISFVLCFCSNTCKCMIELCPYFIKSSACWMAVHWLHLLNCYLLKSFQE